MAIEAVVEGNLLAAPVTKMAPTKEGQKPVVELRVMAASYRPETDEAGQTRYIQDDKKTIPVQVSIWSEKLGNKAMKLLKTGASVKCSGQLYASPYTDSQDQVQAGLSMAADSVTLGLSRVEEVVYRVKTSEQATA